MHIDLCFLLIFSCRHNGITWFLFVARSFKYEMKATEKYFPVVLFITLHKLVLTFQSVDEILKCDHSNESY